MRIDLEKVESQIKRLEELKRIASDPELMLLLETVVVRNGTSAAEPDSAKMAQSIAQPRPVVSGRSSTGQRKGFVLSAIKDAAMRHDGRFSGYTLAGEMQAKGFSFTAEKPGLAVTDGLRSLVKKGFVRLVRKGRGSEPALYERILQ